MASFDDYAMSASACCLTTEGYVLEAGQAQSLTEAKYEKEWDNELHPTPRGFNKIVNERWIPFLQTLGYADKS